MSDLGPCTALDHPEGTLASEQAVEIPLQMPPKLGGFDFWRQALNSARYVVAPMVSPLISSLSSSRCAGGPVGTGLADAL